MGWMRVMLGLSFMLSRMIFEFFFLGVQKREEERKEEKKVHMGDPS